MGRFEDIYKVVKSIEKGKVASYGLVSRLAGYPKGAKFVGFALHQNPDPASIPCHRVVKKDGSLSSAFAFGGIERHAQLLRDEGVEITDNKVDMERYSLDVLYK